MRQVNSPQSGDDDALSPEELFTLVMDGVPGLIAYVNAQLRYVLVNERYAAWYGLTKEQITGKHIHDVLTEEAAYQRAKVQYDRALRGERVAFTNDVLRGGQKRTVSVEFVPRIAQDGRVLGFFALIQDITFLRETEAELRALNQKLSEQLAENEKLHALLREQAIRDALTGLFNRRYLEETLVRELAQAERDGAPLSLVMLDIDFFKRVNDTYGHMAGDHLLQALGGLLRSNSRQGDIACRYGGEEFVLVLPGTLTLDAAQRVEDWRMAFQEACQALGIHDFPVTISAGVAAFPVHGRSAEALLDAADHALYDAKALGRNRVVIYHTPLA
jgi:diguanylate cyclase (GGDEF)-like protein/PAS domain S-box-containing protein